MTYIFDGSYVGLLSAVFTAFERKQFHILLNTENNRQDSLFEQPVIIISDEGKATRIWNGLDKIISKNNVQDFWKAYLSEDPKIYQVIFNIIVSLFQGNKDILANYGNPDVLSFHQTLKKVGRERHRVKAFVRFQKSEDGLFTAVMEPDFNVLPLVASFFRNRYADQRWLIYDKKRNYGLYYDLQYVTEVTLTVEQSRSIQKSNSHIQIDANDKRFESMWKSYFDSTNIVARKNMKLHLQHVPKRYWRYLPEKSFHH